MTFMPPPTRAGETPQERRIGPPDIRHSRLAVARIRRETRPRRCGTFGESRVTVTSARWKLTALAMMVPILTSSALGSAQRIAVPCAAQQHDFVPVTTIAECGCDGSWS